MIEGVAGTAEPAGTTRSTTLPGHSATGWRLAGSTSTTSRIALYAAARDGLLTDDGEP
jgi:hypothetical protein